MILDLLAALRAIPKIVDALERLGDVATAAQAQARENEKNDKIYHLIDAARERRMHKREAERVSGDSRETSTGDGADNGASGE